VSTGSEGRPQEFGGRCQASGSILGNVADNDTLVFNRSYVVTFPGLISGSGGLAQIGLGTTRLPSSTLPSPNDSSARRLICFRMLFGQIRGAHTKRKFTYGKESVSSWIGVRMHVMRNAKPPQQSSGSLAPVSQ
jgi:hypothetical protein